MPRIIAMTAHYARTGAYIPMNTLKAKDLINIGIYSALYFICMALAAFLTGFVTGMILPGFSSILLPGIVGLIAGPVYMLISNKVPRFGGITIMGILMGLFFLVSGHFAFSFIPYVFCGVLADFLQNVVGKGKSEPMRYLSYTIFAFGNTGPALPLWFMKNAYVASLVRKGKNQAYIDKVFAQISTPTLIICVVVTIAGALLGAWIGSMIVKRHFARIPAKA
ncbi:MptD family putative ECF transporter S component [Bifidobacterium coryneforme]|uniref:MptD family putative ECF transporter S component n=1 Tax=Bifidobacterium coryneforme TaxID=1687 RepID=UPI0004E5C1FB|nr:MptD family putative ECF transporter S component [Bifidobacterium coryneforme]AII74094.1 putative membrane protein [Bifidobacterium coryneforme]